MTSPLPPVRRLVTDHDKDASAVVSSDDSISAEILPHGVASSVIWATHSSPAELGAANDGELKNVGFVTGGSVVRIVDIPPHSTGDLHRTISLDHIIVLQGPVTLVLDNGSRTTIETGQIVIQQATMHGWDNESDHWTRLYCVMLPAKPPSINGKELKTVLDFS